MLLIRVPGLFGACSEMLTFSACLSAPDLYCACDAIQGGACTMAATMTSAQQLALIASKKITMFEGILRSLDAAVMCNAQAKPRESPDVATAHQNAHNSFCMRSSGAFAKTLTDV